MSPEQMPTKENLISYRRASNTNEDIDTLITVEQSVAGQSTYSPMLTKEEWIEALKNTAIFFIENAQKQIARNRDSNGPARKLYESFGFVISQELENYFGDGEPRLEMVLKR